MGHTGVSAAWLGKACVCFSTLQDQEKHDSDLRGSRGVLLVGVLMLIMAFSNFRNTVRSNIAPAIGAAADASALGPHYQWNGACRTESALPGRACGRAGQGMCETYVCCDG